MRIEQKEEPRRFNVGKNKKIVLSDWGRIFAGDDELLTFVTPKGKEYDICAKTWGFYATPSMNGRLKAQGFKSCLVKGDDKKLFVMVVDDSPDKLEEFRSYCSTEKMEIIRWFDEE